MPTPNFPYLTTNIIFPTDGRMYARIVPGTFADVPADVMTQFQSAIKESTGILPSGSKGKSGIKSLTGGGWEVKINSGERLFTSSGSLSKENGCPLMVFDRYKAKHG